jgi:cyanate permease
VNNCDVNAQYKVYGYRWVVLAALMLVNVMMQVLWACFSPVLSVAADYYGTSEMAAGWLSMVFMVVFVIGFYPASWLINSQGFRYAVGVGSVLMGVFAVARYLAGANFWLAFTFSIGISLGQPLLMNTWTHFARTWYPEGRRAAVVGLLSFSMLSGVAITMSLTPFLVESTSFTVMQLAYGLSAAVSAALFIVLAREQPATPVGPSSPKPEFSPFEGFRALFRTRSFGVCLFATFVTGGVVLGITTWIAPILQPRGFSSVEVGFAGTLLTVGGLGGAVVLTMLSDRQQTRVRWLRIGLLVSMPAVVGIAFLPAPSVYFALFALGFFALPHLPLWLQYAAELTRPIPEATSAGVVQAVEQVSVAFIYLMGALRMANGSFAYSLMVGIGLLIPTSIIVWRLKDATPSSLTGARSGHPGPAEDEAALQP